LTLVTEHGAAILTMIRMMATEDETAGEQAHPQPPAPNGYQPIPVTVVE
jgi:hypothetical protein